MKRWITKTDYKKILSIYDKLHKLQITEQADGSSDNSVGAFTGNARLAVEDIIHEAARNGIIHEDLLDDSYINAYTVIRLYNESRGE